MATRNISLTEKLDRFVEEQVRSGEYQNASEVVRAALRRLQSDAEERALKIERFKALLKEGEDDLAAGRYVDIEWDDLDDYLEGLGRPSR